MHLFLYSSGETLISTNILPRFLGLVKSPHEISLEKFDAAVVELKKLTQI